MQTPKPLRTLHPAAFGASLAMAMAGGAPSIALAQAPPATEETALTDAIALPPISVGGTAPVSPNNPLRGDTGLGRLQGPIQDLPQSVAVVPREVLQQQNATTLGQALRNVPGITSTVGEGGGGVQGDQLRIRGFNAQNDIYVDGLRDFGAYVRDAFTYEDVAVYFGPSGLTFGAGSVGGLVNVTSRMPHLGNSYAGDASAGSGAFLRGTADINQQIGETTAFRLNMMGQRFSSVPGRDHQDGTRWGIAPSVAFGLGTDLTLSVQYMHYQYDNSVDAGVPVLTPPGTAMGQPATQFGLRRANFYGSLNDRDKVSVDRVTARLQWRASDWLTLYNDTRTSFINRDFAYTLVSCDATCTGRFFNGGGTPMYAVSNGPSSPYSQYTWGVQNITTARADFTTGPLRHELAAGIDAWWETSNRNNALYDPARPGGNLLSPADWMNSYSFIPSTAANAIRGTQNATFALFATDRIWLMPELSIIAGLRWSRFLTSYTAYGPTSPATNLNSNTNFVDPRAALVWEPAPNQTYYFSYGTSSTPLGSNFAVLPGQATLNNSLLQPERNTIYELGAKYSAFDNRLGLTAALFRIEKSNALTVDPLTGLVAGSGDKQQNQGLELGAVGNVTPNWLLSWRYTYMDSQIVETSPGSTNSQAGNRVQFVPRNAMSLWSTYQFFPGQDYNITLGGGMTWRSQVFLNNLNTQTAPANLSFDAMVSHQIRPQLRAQLNVYNIGDALNYDTIFANRVTPSAGRTFVFSLAGTF